MWCSGCSAGKIEQYKEEKPVIGFEEYFNGPIKGWGIVQNWKGDVVTRFDVVMVGRWKDGVGTLEEDFTYYNGKTQKRIWTIRKKEDGTYEGSADDIMGKASGKASGNAVRWNYTMDVPVDDATYRLVFDDWMWKMNDGVVINRSYMKKFGITVAELTLMMQKQ
ncbi:MAG: DUF3833 domain-containing protein [Alphaproteobacteria bacterium]|nr:DUF3833 domain-containing protein [Alphaproteobacteria bacterium]